MKKLLLLGMALVLTATLVGCGGGSDDEVLTVGPGLVGIDDSLNTDAPPRLNVTYTDPSIVGTVNVDIFSEPAFDGDIAHDPVTNSFTVTLSPLIVLFGLDHLNPVPPEFRAFLTFPLDGITGQPEIPSTAVIVSAFLEVLVDQVNFFSIIPSFIDLVEYPVLGTLLSEADFNTVPLDSLSLDFFFDDPGNLVRIDVTQFMQLAQLPPALPDFQVRFLVDRGGTLSATRTPAKATTRTIHSPSRAMDNVAPKRGPSTAKPGTQLDKSTRHR
jgi:hypothetical protein